MKIVISKEDGEVLEYKDVSDYYLAVRQPSPLANPQGSFALEMVTRSYSHSGGHIRDIVKELRQSLIEIQSHLDQVGSSNNS